VQALSADWNSYDFVVQMPHMAPGEKLSEVEFLKILAAYQWESIARSLGRRPPAITSAEGERLYGSVIDVELHLGERHSMEVLGEDVSVRVRNQVRFYAKRFVEGLFVIDDREIPDALVGGIQGRKDLRSFRGSWACMTNAFIARAGESARLKVFRPAGIEAVEVAELHETPLGIEEQGGVQRTGELELPDGDPPGALPLRDRGGEPILYPLIAESDLNGAGLVYFARYEAMMNYGERIFLSRRLERPVSSELVACLSTEHRRAYFFANANPTEVVDVRVAARLLPPGSFTPPEPGRPFRVPFKVLFRIDLYRGSDGMLMASSQVRKSLTVPANAKAVLAEAERLLRWVA
jgi:probable biosynthetic protein (TIGR04098 family)